MQRGGEATAADWDDVPRRLDERGSTAVAEAVDFEAFVASRSGALLRTAYLLTRDRGLAEDLLQTALAKAWRAWERIDDHPEPYVRKILVNTYASWWRRRWNVSSRRPSHRSTRCPVTPATCREPICGRLWGGCPAGSAR